MTVKSKLINFLWNLDKLNIFLILVPCRKAINNMKYKKISKEQYV